MAKNGGKRVTAKKDALEGQVVKGARVRSPAATIKVAPMIEAEEPKSKPVRNYKTHTKKLIAKQFSGIMESMAVKSKEGSLAHVKFLFEIGGVKEDLERQGRGKSEPSLADLLLAEVRRQHAANVPTVKGLLETGEDLETIAIDEDTDEGATS
jgi:hypothetical protein